MELSPVSTLVGPHQMDPVECQENNSQYLNSGSSDHELQSEI